jgi:hypothetical protein
MATISVHTFCRYLTSVGGTPWRNADWTANKLVKVLKGDTFKGYFDLTLPNGQERRFTQANAKDVLPVVHAVMAKMVRDAAPNRLPVSLVPIPNSSVTTVGSDAFRTRTLADGIATASGDGIVAVPAIVFTSAQTPSHKGGSRDPEYLQSQMKLAAKVRTPVILMDDVMTTGAHLIAAARLLREQGIDVLAAVAFAEATPEQEESVFRIKNAPLDLDPPQLDWSAFL